ncbi:hypothetical protein ACQEV2_31030 [Streptomyces sp. CA-251387]|uniref:hypothetical protein n=1 Tax=Streptomyces sp. CA-251387 TaxID=3240064 RepID=UPI003D931E91
MDHNKHRHDGEEETKSHPCAAPATSTGFWSQCQCLMGETNCSKPKGFSDIALSRRGLWSDLLSRRSGVTLIGGRGIRLLSGRVDRLAGRVTHVLGRGSGTGADRSGAGIAAAAQYGKNDDCANYGSKADYANHKDDEAH